MVQMMVGQRREWQQRIQATLDHHGVPARSWLLGLGRAWLSTLELPPAGGARADHGCVDGRRWT
jgi:hypothetical protein